VIGEDVTFDGRLARDPDGVVVAWAWQIGPDPIQTSSVVVRTFDSAGTYPIRFTVTDDDGASSTAFRRFEVREPEPIGCPGGGCH